MAEFAPALSVLLAHEGGYVDDPKDPGGATRYGISLAFLRQLGSALGDRDGDGDVDADDIRKLTPAAAAAIYRSQWWDRYGYGLLTSQAVATKVLDSAVPLGPRVAHKLLQAAACRSGHRCVIDGAWGPQTVGAVNAAGDGILPIYRALLEQHYRLIATQNPNLKKFLNGWVARARS